MNRWPEGQHGSQAQRTRSADGAAAAVVTIMRRWPEGQHGSQAQLTRTADRSTAPQPAMRSTCKVPTTLLLRCRALCYNRDKASRPA